MYNLFFAALFFLASPIALIAQQKDPAVISAAAGTGQTPSASYEWTMGEPIVFTNAAGDKIFTQGFHQPVVLSKNKSPIIVKAEVNNVKISIAPNPVNSVLQVNIASKDFQKFNFILSTIDGKKLLEKTGSGYVVSERIGMQHLPAGLYILNVVGSAKRIQSFKIVKQ